MNCPSCMTVSSQLCSVREQTEMKYAVISVSSEGAKLGAAVKRLISGNGVLYERKGSESGGEANYFLRTFSLVKEIFSQYDGLLFIMASGIAVRAIAPYIVSKVSDPAVLVMDECGRHCISLLSGHLGGANAWAREVALAVGADPVITTATDVHQRRAPDDIARELMMRVEPVQALKAVNSVIAGGKIFMWFLDPETEGADSIRKRMQDKGIPVHDIEEAGHCSFDACAVITEKTYSMGKPFVYLRPKNLYVGIGCKRGTEEAVIDDALKKALQMAGAYEYQIVSLASVTLKADEKGLLAFAKHKNRNIHFYTPEELKKVEEKYHLPSSEFVQKTIGVGNICQTSAIMESKQGKTILPKTKFTGVTIAIAMGLSV